jgi:Ser/Thr protein kinase RdoA (MazF antagonist)
MDGPLLGGNMNDVERQGDTVLRNAGPWTPTVHRYLDYLAMAGVDATPRALGVEDGRERLTFVEGEVPLYPLPTWVFEDSVLEEGARLLRELHDASIGFPLDGATWQAPAKVPMEVVCHNDFSPHNLVFRDGKIVGVIDVDMCSPGPRLWDIAYFATRAVPLTAVTPENAPGMSEAQSRVERILRAYGSEATWIDVLRVAIIRLDDLAQMSIEKAEELDKPHLLAEAHEYERDAGFLRELMRRERARR